MPEEALPPPVLTVPMPGATTAGRYRLVGFEGENDRASLALLSSAMTTGSVDDIRTAGGANVVQRGEHAVLHLVAREAVRLLVLLPLDGGGEHLAPPGQQTE